MFLPIPPAEEPRRDVAAKPAPSPEKATTRTGKPGGLPDAPGVTCSGCGSRTVEKLPPRAWVKTAEAVSLIFLFSPWWVQRPNEPVRYRCKSCGKIWSPRMDRASLVVALLSIAVIAAVVVWCVVR